MRLPDAAAVGLELGLARPARADPAAEARHGGAFAHQPRQRVAQLGELHLQLALARASVAGEHVEDELGAVEHAAV